MVKEKKKNKSIKKRKRGFTLIELLAVILILGIIALIAIPTVNSVIKTSREEAEKRSIENIIKEIESRIMIEEMKEKPIENGIYSLDYLRENGFDIKGMDKFDGIIAIKKGEITSYSISSENFKDNTEYQSTLINIVHENNETHFGIVYLDPTDITKVCSASDAENNMINSKYSGVKTGCMKWYILGKDDNNYNLLLDHNTTAHVAWNLESTLEPTTVSKQLETDTKDWSKYITPYIIAKSEIDEVVKPKTTSVYFLDGGTATQPAEVKGKGLSNYYWLYDNVSSCEARGCRRQENTNFGYWTTKSYIDKATGNVRVWIQSWEGEVLTVLANRADTYGLRPAIKVPKGFFK